MAKKNKQSNVISPTLNKEENAVVVESSNISNSGASSWMDKLTQGFIPYIIIVVFSLGLYANTFQHQYALDDEIVISKNEYVLQGIAGLSDIFSKDLFDSFYRQMNTKAQLSGGRYRPLSVASFAIEQEFIGTRENANFEPTIWDANKNGKGDPEEDINGDGLFNDRDYKARGFGFRHVNNVLFYGLAVSMLFLFLSSVVFKSNKWLALIISLLFLAHPIHTEVVANVKSRDEIFSFLFMMLSLILAHKAFHSKTIKHILLTALCFFCAILSKEYGATLLVLIPLSLYLFEPEFKVGRIMGTMIGIGVSFFMYIGLRSKFGLLVGENDLQEGELLNNPFLLADDMQKIATKFFIFLKYLMVQLLPHPLSSDYGYNSIPYKDFSHPGVMLGIVLLIGLIALAFWALKKRNWLAFAIAFYMGNILLVTNFIFNVGATMGERLVFHSSLGLCMVLGVGIVELAKRIKQPTAAMLILLPILFLYSVKTISRNKAWKNDITLALTDVEIMPESTSLNGNASSRNIDLSEYPQNKAKEKEYLAKAIHYGIKATTLHPGFVNGYMNLGLAYAKLEQFDSAKVCWDKAFKLYPSHPSKPVYYGLLAEAFNRKAYACGQTKNWAEGKMWLMKAVEVKADNPRFWYDLGGFAFNSQDYVKAKEAWTKAYQLNPNDPEIVKVQGLLK